jgi:hypothetical protein
MAKSMERHGQMRQFIADMMVSVKNGDTKVDEARTVLKMAEKVTENLYAETKTMMVLHELGKKVPELGELKIDPAA